MTQNIRTGVGIIASITVIFAAAAWAHTAGVFAIPTAVAIVDIGVLQDGLDEQHGLMEALRAKYKHLQDELAQMQAEFQVNRQRLEDEGPTMTKDEFQSLEIATALLGQQHNYTQDILKYAQDTGRHAIMRDIYPKIYDAINRVAQRDDWDIVLLDTSDIDPTKPGDFDTMNRAVFSKHVLYVNPNVDITNEVILLLNNEYANRQAAPPPGAP